MITTEAIQTKKIGFDPYNLEHIRPDLVYEDVYATLKFKVDAGEDIGIVIRANGPTWDRSSNGLKIVIDRDAETCVTTQKIAGVETELDSSSITYLDYKILEVTHDSRDFDLFTVKYNGDLIYGDFVSGIGTGPRYYSIGNGDGVFTVDRFTTEEFAAVKAEIPLTLGAGEIDGITLNADTTESVGANIVTDSGFDAVTKATAKGVAGITKANPGVVTFDAAHGYADGDIIYFSGLTEMTELNGQYWQLQNNAGDTFELAVVYGGASLDTSGYGAAETTGGNCAQACSFTSWVQGTGWHVGVDGAGALTGKAQKVAGTASFLQQLSIISSGPTYRHAITVADRTAGYAQSNVGGDAGTGMTAGTYVGDYVSASTGLQIYASNTFDGTLDNATVRQVTNPKQNGITIELHRDSERLVTYKTVAGVSTVLDDSAITYSATVAPKALHDADGRLVVIYDDAIVYQGDVTDASIVNNKRHYVATGEGSGAFSVERLRYGAEIATGTCTISLLYYITATEADHFAAGLVVGDYFISDGTETLDANNKVKQVNP